MTTVRWFLCVVIGLVALPVSIVVGLAAPVALAQSAGVSPSPVVERSSIRTTATTIAPAYSSRSGIDHAEDD